MAKFSYRIKDAAGQSQKGTVEALTLRQAINLLHERGFFIIEIKELQSAIPILHSGGGKMSFSDLVYITRQLSTMITAGLTLVEALALLRQQLRSPAAIKLITQVEEEVRGGKSFAETLEKHPKVFPSVYLALVRAGEASGKFDTILARLADNLEKSRDFRSKIRGVMLYPSIVMGGMALVSGIVMTVVVPKLTSLYKDFGVELPLPTKILIAMSDFFVNFWLILVILIAGIGFAAWRFSHTKTGKYAIATVSLQMPIVGPLLKQSTLVEITRTLSLLVDGGVPILSALRIAQEATSNVLFKDGFIEAAKKVEKGFPLSEHLTNSPLFPPILGQMVAVGEQTGKLGESLLRISQYFEAEADTMVRSLTTIIEPLIMVVLGFGVGFLVIAILMPIYSLTSKF